MRYLFISFLLCIVHLSACKNPTEQEKTPTDFPEDVTLRLVVHIIHNGEPIGQGTNLSDERILNQIESLNKDFAGLTDLTDTHIRFQLADCDSNCGAISGINRINHNDVVLETNSTDLPFDWLPQYGYSNPEKIINVWVMPSYPNIFLGSSTLPTCDLPGLKNEVSTIGEGLLINTHHFGHSDVEGDANLGKTLTHEMGHFLGLEHLWGKKENGSCFEFDDYVDDTPPVTKRTSGCNTIISACDGQTALTNNFMDYNADVCMTSFTEGQISRMHYVLEHAKNRTSLVQ